MGRPSQIELVDMPVHLRGKYQYFTQADMTRFRETNYPESLTPLHEAVGDYVRNYLMVGGHLGDEPWDDEGDLGEE